MAETNLPLAKIHFELHPDEDGYPPCQVESLWAIIQPDGTFVLDNVPFFTREATLGDRVVGRNVDGEFWYRATEEPSKNSLVRVIMLNEELTAPIRESLKSLGCDTEFSHLPNLFSVSIPPTADWARVQSALEAWQEEGILDYEEALNRHEWPPK
jgi:hypothetical protein